MIQGTIKRRVLLNFRAEPGVVAARLPGPFRPKLHRGHAIVGVCLVRLEQVRPQGLPAFVGVSSENAAHRIAVEWTDAEGQVRDGVFVVRRDTGSVLNRWAGGRLFPGDQRGARFEVSDSGHGIRFVMESFDREVRVEVFGEDAPYMPKDSCFQSLGEASEFFETGSVGYSATRDAARFDGLRLCPQEWDCLLYTSDTTSTSTSAPMRARLRR